MSVKQYTSVEVAILVYQTQTDPGWVKASDYSALLAVLRRCVTAMERAQYILSFQGRTSMAMEVDAALAAARAVLEEEAKP